MKKSILVTVMFFSLVSLFGQGIRLQSVSAGVIPAVVAYTNLEEVKFQTGAGFLAYANAKFPKSYVTAVYNFGGQSVLGIYGRFLDKQQNQDLYLVAGKNIAMKGGYLAVGYEIYIGYALPFVEFGTDWSNIRASSTYLTVGTIFPLSKTIWKKKP
ncbi:MAG: hypothetical protein H6765_07355 [Candidatus Peribacteria bacterium]|nr:MAG: hypothetical protein H6765_07355 [Candidatus Peribacteria bacterium]